MVADDHKGFNSPLLQFSRFLHGSAMAAGRQLTPDLARRSRRAIRGRPPGRPASRRLGMSSAGFTYFSRAGRRSAGPRRVMATGRRPVERSSLSRSTGRREITRTVTRSQSGREAARYRERRQVRSRFRKANQSCRQERTVSETSLEATERIGSEPTDGWVAERGPAGSVLGGLAAIPV